MADDIRFEPLNDGSEEDCQCARCGSSVVFIDCENCADGFTYHDCGEDTCCCLYPEDNVVCDVCDGDGGWWQCCSSPEWCNANPLLGREHMARDKVEWFSIPDRDPRTEDAPR